MINIVSCFNCRSVGTFARALDCSSSIKQPSLHMSAAAASRDITLVSLVIHILQVYKLVVSRVHVRPRLWSNYNRIKYEMGSHQLITVPDYNWITITSNNPLGVVWSNYSAWLNKMADTWWFEETKLCSWLQTNLQTNSGRWLDVKQF